MPDFWYPHTATIQRRGQAVDPDTKQAGNLAAVGDPETLQCDIQRQTTEQELLMFGLDTKNPAVLYCALEDRATLNPEDKVIKGSDVFLVVGDAKVKDDGFGLDHCVFPLKGLQVTT